MGNLTNLQRDMLHVDMTPAELTAFGTTSTINRFINMDAVGTANELIGCTAFLASATNVADFWSGLGVFMTPPSSGIPVPYRFKLYASADGLVNEMYAFVALGPASLVTGTNSCSRVHCFPMRQGHFDEVISIAPESTGNAIGFGFAVGEATGANCEGHISVQNLSAGPPVFNSISVT